MSLRQRVAELPLAAKLNLTPMIDMVFILLIFFLVSSSFAKEQGVEVSRPQAQSAQPQVSANIFIVVTSSGAVQLDGREVRVDAVRAQVERLHHRDPGGSVVIVADRAAPTGVVVEVLDQARLAGVSQIALAAEERGGT